MKKHLTTLVLISVLFTTCFTNAYASDGKHIQVKSPQEVANTLNKKGKKIVKNNSEDLNIYLAVMELYANDAASFYNLDDATQTKFISAAENLNRTLAASGKKELRLLANQIGFNQAVSTYIWNFKKSKAVVIPVLELAQQTSL